MSANNDFLPFATGSGANVEAQADYLVDGRRISGEVEGPANEMRANKAWRQSSVAAAGIAQFAANRGVAMPDDGDPVAFASRFNLALRPVVISTQTVNATTPSITLPFTAGAWGELALIVDGSSSAQHAVANLAFADASGTYSAGIPFLTANDANSDTTLGSFGIALIRTLDLSHSICAIAAGFGSQGSPFEANSTFGSAGATTAVRHAGGLAGLSVTAVTGNLTSGTYTLLGVAR